MSPFGFLKKSQTGIEEREAADSGFLVFENTSEVIQAETFSGEFIDLPRKRLPLHRMRLQ